MLRAMSTYIQSSINTATLINASEKRRQTRTAQTLPSEAKVSRSFRTKSNVYGKITCTPGSDMWWRGSGSSHCLSAGGGWLGRWGCHVGAGEAKLWDWQELHRGIAIFMSVVLGVSLNHSSSTGVRLPLPDLEL